MIQPMHCSSCFKEFDAHSSINSGEDFIPVLGDISICLYCGTICVFNDDLKLRTATEEDLRKVEPEDLVKIGKAVEYIKQQIEKS